jgi:hypothetical protein
MGSWQKCPTRPLSDSPVGYVMGLRRSTLRAPRIPRTDEVVQITDKTNFTSLKLVAWKRLSAISFPRHDVKRGARILALFTFLVFYFLAVTKMLSSQCWACRWRRVRCDTQQPACTQCTLKGLPCPGYGATKPLKWRHCIVQHHQPQIVSQPRLTSEDGMASEVLPPTLARDVLSYCRSF